MKRLPILFVLFYLVCIPGVAQQYLVQETFNVDSLLTILPGQEGEEKVNTLNNLANTLSFQDIDLCRQYAGEAIELATALGYQAGVAAGYRNLGHMHFYNSDYPDALNNYLEALRIYENLDRRNTVGRICYDIAKTHYMANNYEKVFEYGNKALAIYRERLDNGVTVGSVRDTIHVIGGFALAYGFTGKIDKSLTIYLQCLEVGKINNFGMTEMLLIEFMIGVDYYTIGEKDSAKVYFDRALTYPDANPGIQALKYRAMTWLGLLYYSEGEFDKAISCLKTAFHWYQENGFLLWAMNTSREIGFCFERNSQIAEAENYYRQSERIFREMLEKGSWYRHDSLKYVVSYGTEHYFPLPAARMKEMMWQQGKWIYGRLYQINKAKKRSIEALEYHERFMAASDTLNELQRNRETIELQTRYETKQKDQQINFLSRENEFKDIRINQSRIIVFSLVALVILVALLAVGFIRQNRFREQQKNLLLQQKLFRLQMNPHFIFNSLASIQGFITEKDPRTASRYLARFAKLVRNIMDSSVDELIPLDEELSTIENYMELQKVRYEGKFDYVIEVDDTIDKELITMPPMLAQPFIENAIEHGIRHKDTTGTIRIRIKQDRNMILLEIEDDGVGRDKAGEILAERDPGHISMATSITREHIDTLNKKLKKKITLDILDMKDETGNPTGTKVIFRIPATSHQ